MKWSNYKNQYIKLSNENSLNQEYMNELLAYAKVLFDKNLPIIFDQKHFSLLLGIDNEYLHRMSNSQKFFYRKFYIEKANGKKRRIDEPLPDLKKIQKWILNELLYSVDCSKYSKAYIPKTSIKDNVKFHRGQKTLVTIDIKNFFGSIKSGHVLSIFLNMGYAIDIAVLLTQLCCYNNSLPQGAPTSAYLSNLIMKLFDENMGSYCIERKMRYTRYADDMSFSGDFNPYELINIVDKQLENLGLSRNLKKTHIMKSSYRQKITGVVVNKKIQMPKEYRDKIRQEIYFINKYGLDNHLQHINETRANYINHLKGKISYCLFINPNDIDMKSYLETLNAIR